MPLRLLVAFYLIMAACEIAFPRTCLYIFEKFIGRTERIRFLSVFLFLISFLYYAAEPRRLAWLIFILFWIYLLCGVWFLAHPKSFLSLCNKSYTGLAPREKRTFLYIDCAFRTILALLLIYAI